MSFISEFKVIIDSEVEIGTLELGLLLNMEYPRNTVIRESVMSLEIPEHDYTTSFDLFVSYNSQINTIDKIKDILIKCALKNGFDIQIEEIDTIEL